MKKKIWVTILLSVSLISIGIIVTVIYKKINSVADMKVLEYKSPTNSEINNVNDKNIIEENESYQIHKLENFNGVIWISNNEILNLKDIGQFNIFTSVNYYSCSIYNVETKESKVYDDVYIESGGVYGVSLDGEYLLYKEGKNTVPYVDKRREEFYNSDKSKSKIKILNLSSGEIKDFEEIETTSSNTYRWIDNNKIICNSNDSQAWYIKDMNGKVYEEGKTSSFIQILQTDNITSIGDELTGEMYYMKLLIDNSGKYDGYSICKLNIKTKECVEIKKIPTSSQIMMAGNIIAETTMEKEINYFDNDGNLIRKIKNEGLNYLINRSVISEAGNIGAFIYTDDYLKEESSGINIIDIKSGAMKELVRINNLKNIQLDNDYLLGYYYNNEKGIREEIKVLGPALKMGIGIREHELVWSKDEKSLVFTYEYNSKQDNKNHIDTYIVKFK